MNTAQLQTIETLAATEEALTSTQALGQADMLAIILVIAIIALLVVGLFKRTLWMCVTAVILSIVLVISNPTRLEGIKDAIVEFFDGAIDPLQDEDYVDMVGEENLTVPNKGFEDIGKDAEVD